MDTIQHHNSDNPLILLSTAELQLTALLQCLGLGSLNRKFLFEAIKKLTKRSIVDRTYSSAQLDSYVNELRSMFTHIFNSCQSQGTAGLVELNNIDIAYFSEGFKENYMTCVKNKGLSVTLEYIAAGWYKLRYSGEVLDYLVQVIIWHERISDQRYQEYWLNAVEVYFDRVEHLKSALKKCGVAI